MEKKTAIVIGGGPAGLFAAETLSAAGAIVHLYDRKASVGRKFLMAGRGGLNLTHSEELPQFLGRYAAAESRLAAIVTDFTPQNLRDWADALGAETFVGSSGRVFPKAFKASPLLRGWLARLSEQGVQFHLQREWQGWNKEGHLVFAMPDGRRETVKGDAVLLALGGASWPGLGSDGEWVEYLRKISVADFAPSNCGFVCEWSDIFKEKFSGQPLKNIVLHHKGSSVQGDAMIAANGMEGGVVYALSSKIRATLEKTGKAVVAVDLRPDLSMEQVEEKLSKDKGKQTFSTHLQKTLSLSHVAINLLRDVNKQVQTLDVPELALMIKSAPITFTDPFPIERAISSAGGIKFTELNDDLMLKKIPGIFAAGEMLDWEAPTGGYLLQACFATGNRAAQGILRFFNLS